MKVSLLSVLAIVLLGAVGHVAAEGPERSLAADTEVELELDEMEVAGDIEDYDLELDEDERELGLSKAQKKKLRKEKLMKKAAKKAAKIAAKKAAKKKNKKKNKNKNKHRPYHPPSPPTPYHPPAPSPPVTKPPPVHPPTPAPKEMYKELIYMEKMCEKYKSTSIREFSNGTAISDAGVQIGDTRSFRCELYEASIKYGQFGGTYVGPTYWYCAAISIKQFNFLLLSFNDALWDCTVTDIIDGFGATYLRNEGVSLYIDEPDLGRINTADTLWDAFHSHTGIFATTGGTSVAKGARGQMEVEWDDYKMTWFHIYTVEVWKLEQKPVLPYN